VILAWKFHEAGASHALAEIDLGADRMTTECGEALMRAFQVGKIMLNRPISCAKCSESLGRRMIAHDFERKKIA